MAATAHGAAERARLYHQDGLIDLGFGLVVLLLGLAERLGWEWSYLGFFAILVWYPLGRLLKERITAPRLGAAPVPPAVTAARRRTALLAGGILTGILALGLLAVGVLLLLGVSFPGQRAAEFVRMLAMLAIGGVLALSAWLVGAVRLCGYLALLVAALLVGQWFPAATSALVIALGAAIVLIGAALLVRFVRTHPLPAGGAA